MNKHWKSVMMIGAAGILLSACHHDNPLRTHSKKESAAFLVNASANVEKRLHFDIAKDAYGYAYLECMDGKKTPEIRCNDLYQGMVAFAKENHDADFKNLTLADLTDPQVFETLGDDYAETAAMSWPHYFPQGKS